MLLSILYKIRGPKPEKVAPLYKIKNLLNRLSEFQENDINEFNLGLGRLYRYLTLTFKCRLVDVEIRK